MLSIGLIKFPPSILSVSFLHISVCKSEPSRHSGAAIGTIDSKLCLSMDPSAAASLMESVYVLSDVSISLPVTDCAQVDPVGKKTPGTDH